MLEFLLVVILIIILWPFIKAYALLLLVALVLWILWQKYGSKNRKL